MTSRRTHLAPCWPRFCRRRIGTMIRAAKSLSKFCTPTWRPQSSYAFEEKRTSITTPLNMARFFRSNLLSKAKAALCSIQHQHLRSSDKNKIRCYPSYIFYQDILIPLSTITLPYWCFYIQEKLLLYCGYKARTGNVLQRCFPPCHIT